MASAYDPQGWAKAPAAMAGQVAKEVLKIDSSLNEAKVEKAIKDVLQTILPEYATGQEDGLKQEFENEKKTLENQLEKTQQSLKECQESSNSTKSLLADKETELLGVEERYTDQLKEMKRNHQEQLTRVDDEISAKNKEIDILKRKAADLERDLIKKVNENDVYVKDLESNAEELSEKVRAEGIKLAQAVADCRNTEDELKQERQEAMNAIKKFEMLKAQSKQDQKVQADTTKKVRELETDNIQHQERIQELETDLANRDATIESLKDEISDIERRKRESISFRSSTGSSSGSGGGNLAAELGAVEEPEEVDLRDEYDRQLKKVEKLEKVVGDLETRLKDNEARCKKEREDLRQQLKKANNKADENALEVRRLKSVDAQLKALQKQEQELQSKLKTTTQSLNRAVEELKMLKDTVLKDNKRIIDQLKAEREKCERERALLNDRIKNCDKERTEADEKITELTAQLKEERKKAKKMPTDDEVRELRAQLARAEKDLKKCTDGRKALQKTIEELQARIKKLTADHEKAIKMLTTSHLSNMKGADKKREEMQNFLIEQIEKQLRHMREVDANLEDQVRINQATSEQYQERIKEMNKEADKNPDGPETPLLKKRAQGVQREIDRMTGIIKTLRLEKEFFQDIIESMTETRKRTDAAAIAAMRQAEQAAREAEEQARERAAEAEERGRALGEAAGRAAAEAEAGPAAPAGAFLGSFNEKVTWSNICLFAAFIITALAQGRELAAWKRGNSSVQRALYINSLDDPTLCLRAPTWQFGWEFLILGAVGMGKWAVS